MQKQNNLKTLSVASDCAWVAEQAEHVKINHDKIGEYAEFIVDKYKGQAMPELFSPECHYINPDSKEDTINYIFALDSINFASGYFRVLKSKYDVDLSYYHIADMLKNAFENDKLNTSQKWQEASSTDFFEFLDINEGQYPEADEMVGIFVEALKDTGDLLVNDYKGSSCKFIEDCDYSSIEIAQRLSELKYFNDYSDYKGKKIAILKRAQILPADIDLVYRPYLTDVEQLTIFADNVVPHTLHHDGVLSYSDELADKIESKTPIKNGGEEEVEMRACSIHAVELMKEFLHAAKKTEVRSVDLDRVLWHRGQDEKKFTSKTTHVTASHYY